MPLSLNHLLSLALSSSRFATQYLILIPPNLRILSFSRSQKGEYPSQQAHMLTKTFY